MSQSAGFYTGLLNNPTPPETGLEAELAILSQQIQYPLTQAREQLQFALAQLPAPVHPSVAQRERRNLLNRLASRRASDNRAAQEGREQTFTPNQLRLRERDEDLYSELHDVR